MVIGNAGSDPGQGAGSRLTVSVALCTFNGENYIAEQVESILNQSLPPLEVVVADDGSTDRTLEIIRETWVKHGATAVALRILPFLGHRGVAKNFELAISEARGELVALSDQDDRWRSDRLAIAVTSFIRNPGLVLQHSDARLVNAMGEPLGFTLFESLYVSEADKSSIGSGHAFATYLKRNLVTGATVIFRRSLFDIAQPFPDHWVHDEWLALIAAAVGAVEILPDQLVDYRQHESNVIGVTRPSLRTKVRRMLEPRGERYREFAARSLALQERIADLDTSVEVIELSRHKTRFETARSRYSLSRLGRILPVLAEFRNGSYRVLSSQGNLDVLRDLLQPR